MMISHDNEFIFIHVPHTGGTSIMGIIRSHVDDLEWRQDIHHDPVPKVKHCVDCFDDYYKFSFVRNHWDWLLSTWSYEYTNRDSIEENNVQNFNDFIKELLSEDSNLVSFPKNGFFGFLGEELCYVDDVAILNEERFVGLNSIIRKSKLGIDWYPHYNKTNQLNRENVYNEETKKMVENYFRDEINYFGFEF